MAYHGHTPTPSVHHSTDGKKTWNENLQPVSHHAQNQRMGDFHVWNVAMKLYISMHDVDMTFIICSNLKTSLMTSK
jgi:hypothetical protein